MLEALQEVLDREPFVPFRIVLTSGDRYEIQDPHLVSMRQSLINVFYPRSDRFAILRMNQVASLEALEQAA
jgi:hypothetical protein